MSIRAIELDRDHIVPIADAFVQNDTGVQLTDDVGLPVDPKFYAKNKCTKCYGRGTFTTTRRMSLMEAATVMRRTYEAQPFRVRDYVPPTDAQLRAFAKDNETTQTHRCGCAKDRYLKAHALVVQENAAKNFVPRKWERPVAAVASTLVGGSEESAAVK